MLYDISEYYNFYSHYEKNLRLRTSTCMLPSNNDLYYKTKRNVINRMKLTIDSFMLANKNLHTFEGIR